MFIPIWAIVVAIYVAVVIALWIASEISGGHGLSARKILGWPIFFFLGTLIFIGNVAEELFHWIANENLPY